MEEGEEDIKRNGQRLGFSWPSLTLKRAQHWEVALTLYIPFSADQLRHSLPAARPSHHRHPNPCTHFHAIHTKIDYKKLAQRGKKDDNNSIERQLKGVLQNIRNVEGSEQLKRYNLRNQSARKHAVAIHTYICCPKKRFPIFIW